MSDSESNVHPFPRGGRDTVNEVEELQRVAREHTLVIPEDVRMGDSPLLRAIIGPGNTPPTVLPEHQVEDNES